MNAYFMTVIIIIIIMLFSYALQKIVSIDGSKLEFNSASLYLWRVAAFAMNTAWTSNLSRTEGIGTAKSSF